MLKTSNIPQQQVGVGTASNFKPDVDADGSFYDEPSVGHQSYAETSATEPAPSHQTAPEYLTPQDNAYLANPEPTASKGKKILGKILTILGFIIGPIFAVIIFICSVVIIFASIPTGAGVPGAVMGVSTLLFAFLPLVVQPIVDWKFKDSSNKVMNAISTSLTIGWVLQQVAAVFYSALLSVTTHPTITGVVITLGILHMIPLTVFKIKLLTKNVVHESLGKTTFKLHSIFFTCTGLVALAILNIFTAVYASQVDNTQRSLTASGTPIALALLAFSAIAALSISTKILTYAAEPSKYDKPTVSALCFLASNIFLLFASAVLFVVNLFTGIGIITTLVTILTTVASLAHILTGITQIIALKNAHESKDIIAPAVPFNSL